MKLPITVLGVLLLVFDAATVQAATAAGQQVVNLTNTGYGYAALAIFVVAYLLVILEENLHLRKSKP
ncbi:MAG TPA: sodium:proton antiporter, partial [Chromatiales bacterium]|nr:sodium:proton antiporter [Chromatiales bacterium]